MTKKVKYFQNIFALDLLTRKVLGVVEQVGTAESGKANMDNLRVHHSNRVKQFPLKTG